MQKNKSVIRIINQYFFKIEFNLFFTNSAHFSKALKNNFKFIIIILLIIYTSSSNSPDSMIRANIYNI